MADTLSYDTWHIDPAREAAMEESHRPLWRHFIETIPERDLATRAVLDFGCNRGGFLRLLHALKPFRHGTGLDIAQESIRTAQALAGTAPLDFAVATDLAPWAGRFDLTFSYEVIYLLPDLAGHAAALHAALKPGGVYYAVTGCHTANPLWPRWRALLGRTTNAPAQDRAPEDYAAAFAAAGFSVSVRRFGYEGFIPLPRNQDHYASLAEALDYARDHKLLFRLEKRAG